MEGPSTFNYLVYLVVLLILVFQYIPGSLSFLFTSSFRLFCPSGLMMFLFLIPNKIKIKIPRIMHYPKKKFKENNIHHIPYRCLPEI